MAASRALVCLGKRSETEHGRLARGNYVYSRQAVSDSGKRHTVPRRKKNVHSSFPLIGDDESIDGRVLLDGFK